MEKNMPKKYFFIVVSLLIVASIIFTGCKTQETTEPETVDVCSSYKAASVEFQSNPFYDAVYSGLKEATDASGGELLRAVSGGDLKKELAAVEDFLAQDIDVLFISVTDPVGSMEAIRKANEAGVPVIFVALGPDSEQDVEYVTFIASNDYNASTEVAEYILKQIGYKGDVVLVDGPQVSVVLERMRAYKDVIAKYPDVNLAGQAMKEEVTIPANATMIENLLTASPETKAILVYAGYGIPAAATVLPNLGMTDVFVGEIDGIPEEIELLASGAVKGATAQQQPYLFGKMAVEAWLKYCADPARTDISLFTEVPTLLITNENAADFLDD
jgi:ribose transport system substrate-binding protein